jgi:hypothetical protein
VNLNYDLSKSVSSRVLTAQRIHRYYLLYAAVKRFLVEIIVVFFAGELFAASDETVSDKVKNWQWNNDMVCID